MITNLGIGLALIAVGLWLLRRTRPSGRWDYRPLGALAVFIGAVGVALFLATTLPISVLEDVIIGLVLVGCVAFVMIIVTYFRANARLTKRWSFLWLLCVAMVFVALMFAPTVPGRD